MKVKVVNVVDTSFDGKDGTKVAACRLVYEVDGKQRALDTYIPPVVTAALAWKPDQEVEIEEYQDKNGKTRFKTPQAGKPGFKGLSYDERKLLDEAQSEAMDRRTALMQAVAWCQGPDGAGRQADTGDVLTHADRYLGWLRSQRQNSPAQANGGRAESTAPPSVPSATVEAPAHRVGSKAEDVEAGPDVAKTRSGSAPADGHVKPVASAAASTSTSVGEDKNQGTVPAESSEEEGKATGEGVNPSSSGYATDRQWAKALTMFGESKANVLKAHAAKFGKSVKAADITEDEMAELLAG